MIFIFFSQIFGDLLNFILIFFNLGNREAPSRHQDRDHVCDFGRWEIPELLRELPFDVRARPYFPRRDFRELLLF